MVNWFRKLKHGVMLRLPKFDNLKRFLKEYKCIHPNSYKLHIGSTQVWLCNECGRFSAIIGPPEIVSSHNILVR